MIGFTDAIKMFFARYTDFQGRSTRAEYWWVVLFQTIVGIVLAIPIFMAMENDFQDFGSQALLASVPLILFVLAIIIPAIALFVRRLHDINQTGWIYLVLIIVSFFPIVGSLSSIAQIVIACIPGTRGPNKYGPDPFGYDTASTFD